MCSSVVLINVDRYPLPQFDIQQLHHPQIFSCCPFVVNHSLQPMATAHMFSDSEFFFSRISYKWNSTIRSLGSGFFHLLKGTEDLSMMYESSLLLFIAE